MLDRIQPDYILYHYNGVSGGTNMKAVHFMSEEGKQQRIVKIISLYTLDIQKANTETNDRLRDMLTSY